ncbi:hypothetical protein [Candidatus Weimeria sp. HCP3S3_B5]|uniref:hypothetical protein n=1 Tax=Candidatus Weimeria sp. HCP3S3_B5 TaxID=3438871 RepID=UPI002A95E63E|nr:hypothetical protein [Lachnospiraceae bacterium]MDY6352240.1 hypothetical protein [Lachnospiraceae bacterium]
MSQEKVLEHKEEKLHRKQIVRKQKRNRFLIGLVSAVICAAFVVWIGWSIYGKVKTANEEASSSKEAAVTPIDLSAINDYTTDLASSIDKK